MQTYARQGGTSTIFVHDDGLQLLNEEEREKRIAFYADHNIGWVARPPHSSSADGYGYKRAGRFKKASNMNYGLQVSNPFSNSSYKVVLLICWDYLQFLILLAISMYGKAHPCTRICRCYTQLGR
jgi:hypothetical protein